MRGTVKSVIDDPVFQYNRIAPDLDLDAADEMQILPEETVQQNSYDQGCQILSLQSEVQIPETVCQKLFECFSDLQLNDQK